MARHRFEPVQYHGTLGSHDPVLFVEPGDTVCTTTVDADGVDAGGIRRTDATNPQTGPFFVRGAESGDVLVVRFEAIWPNRDWAEIGTSIAPDIVDPDYVPELPAARQGGLLAHWRIDRELGTATFVDPVTRLPSPALEIDPMLGCFGVAPPEGGEITTATAGPYGGNMDYRGFRAGVSVQLPVFAEGALFHLGDGHALQGDGEVVGGGLEVSMDVEFSLTLCKRRTIHWPRAEDAGYLFTVGNAWPLEQALRHATTEMLRWLQQDFALDPVSANMLLGVGAEYDIGTVYGPAYSVACKVAKRLLPSKTTGGWLIDDVTTAVPPR
jgi:amidase